MIHNSAPAMCRREWTRGAGALGASSSALLIGGGVLGIASLIRWVTGISAIFLGPFSVSVASASHLLFYGAVALLASSLLRPLQDQLPSRLLLFGMLFLLTAALDSPIRRVGDGHEYLVMSRNLGLGRPPSASESDLAELQSKLAAAGDGSWTAGLDPSLRDRQARFAFAHFWLFPLLAAPMVA